MIDADQLIALVYERRAIWDKRVKEHANRSTVDKCWNEISAIVEEEEHKLKKKWKYLRDQFTTEVSKTKQPRSGDGGGEIQTSKWQYFKSLYFLRDIVKARPSSGNLTVSEEVKDQEQAESVEFHYSNNVTGDKEHVFGDKEAANDSIEPDEENTSFNNLVTYNTPGSSHHDVTSLEEQESSSTVQPTQHRVKRIKRPRTDDYTTSILEIERKKLDILTQKMAKQGVNESEDEHFLFFKTLLPHVKKIRPENVLTFRGRIQEVVQQFAYPVNYHAIEPLNPVRSTTPYSTSSNTSTVTSIPLDNNNEYPSSLLSFFPS